MVGHRARLPWIVLLIGVVAGTTTPADEPVVPRDWLVIAQVDVRGRRPFNPNAVFARHLLDPASPPPKEGEKLTGELGNERVWTRIPCDANGRVAGELDGAPLQAAFTTVDWPDESVALADLDGAGAVWVNGVPQVGDPYEDGMGGLPVAMKKGTNAIFVTGVRGGYRLAFSRPPAALLVNPFDATVPDLVAGKPASASVGLLVVNATDRPLDDLMVECGSEGADGPFERNETRAVGLPPLGIVKLRVDFVPNAGHPVFAAPGRASASVNVRAGELTASSTISFEIKPPGVLRRESYVSLVDDSVQAYAVLPPSDGEADALVLTLHGAGVDCQGQAAAYSSKPDFWIVAPTNRRRFGFDWQDWGRRDAYDVLDLAVTDFGIDRRRVCLTGHSMGGHGTWHLAANDPSTFAAIAPSAGWSSFDAYGGGRPKGALAEVWRSADGASRTLDLVDNLKQLPTYVLHGSDDDNVPASEARLMLDALAKAGGKPQSHFQEGAGHWWDGDAAPGADCVDWPAIFDLFRASVRPELPERVSFTGSDPSVRSSCDWVSVLALERYGAPFRVEASFDAEHQRGTVTTRNVRVLGLSIPHGTLHEDDDHGRSWSIDGDDLPDPGGSVCLEIERAGGHWTAGATDAGDSWTERRKTIVAGDCAGSATGPFKQAFDHRFALVYGTRGTAAETRALLERARYDASHWWVRGNGHALVISDARALELGVMPDEQGPFRNVVLYGNRDTNGAWAALVPEGAPFDAGRGRLRLGERKFEGDALGACVVLPHPIHGLVGLFADSGPRGSRLGYTLAPFISGVGYPDYALFSPEIPTKGDGGVLAAGWFDHAWRLQAP